MKASSTSRPECRISAKPRALVPLCPQSRKGRIPMKMIKAIVKKFKRDEDLANHAWVLHVI